MITPKQIRAARAFLGWSQQDLADAIDLSKPTIVDAEKDGHQSRAETLGLITGAFEDQGLEFIPGGVKQRDDIYTIFRGENCYLELIDKAFQVLSKNRGEYLLYGASEKRSSQIIRDRQAQIVKNGIPRRFLIQPGDTHILGNLDEYKWMPEKLWVESDVKIIFQDFVGYLVSWQPEKKVILLKDQQIARMEKMVFDYVWDMSMSPTHSSAKNEEKYT